MSAEEKNEIKDAEVIDKEKKNDSKIKIDFRFELALFLILGFLLGVVIKTEAVKRITIGFNDSEIPSLEQSYDFKKISEDLVKQTASSQNQESPAENQAPAGSSNQNNQ